MAQAATTKSDRLALWAFAFMGLRSSSYWIDELWTIYVINRPAGLAQVFQRTLTDTHPPLYYLLLRLSSSILGQSEVAARAPSALFGVMTLLAAATLSRSSLARSSRLALLLFLALSPGAVWYAREARSYGLLLLFSTVITLACLNFVRCRPEEYRKAREALVTLTACSVLASFTHYFGFLIAGAAFLTCCLLTHSSRRPIGPRASSRSRANIIARCWRMHSR